MVIHVMAFSVVLLYYTLICLLNMGIVRSTSPFLANTPGLEWKIVGYLDMTDPTQQCPDSWQTITSPRSSCGRKSSAPCDSLNISTSGASYKTVCGRFRGYQVGSPDAFRNLILTNIETYYVDGATVTYGLPGNRHHVYTYATGVYELNTSPSSCPCTGAGAPPPLFVGSDYYCESGTLGPYYDLLELYSSDVLWDRQQCGGNESTCCNSTDLPWFCKTFPNPISENLEVRICTDEGRDNENVAIESFELYIHVQVNHTAVNYTAVDCTAVNYTAAVDYTSLASIATSTIIGITIVISFVVFFSLGVLLATGIGCVMKARSKDTPDQQKMVYDEIGPHRGAIEMETNSAYLSMTGRV